VETPEKQGRWIAPDRDYSLLALVLGAAYFVCLFLPWFGFAGRDEAGWTFAGESGVAALALVLCETLRISRAWTTRGSEILGFALAAGTSLLAAEALANLRWGGPFGDIRFSTFRYGAWISLAIAVLLLVVAALRLSALRRSVP
jgi:hypothetical protein